MNNTICLINKEEIPQYEMSKTEVLTSPTEISSRRHDVERAMKLGNNEHLKVKIIFETTQGTMAVETTVWEVTQNYLILKSNMAMPIKCIHRIEFL